MLGLYFAHCVVLVGDCIEVLIGRVCECIGVWLMSDTASVCVIGMDILICCRGVGRRGDFGVVCCDLSVGEGGVRRSSDFCVVCCCIIGVGDGGVRRRGDLGVGNRGGVCADVEEIRLLIVGDCVICGGDRGLFLVFGRCLFSRGLCIAGDPPQVCLSLSGIVILHHLYSGVRYVC